MAIPTGSLRTRCRRAGHPPVWTPLGLLHLSDGNDLNNQPPLFLSHCQSSSKSPSWTLKSHTSLACYHHRMSDVRTSFWRCGGFCVFLFKGCIHFTQEMHAFVFLFFFGPAKRQKNLKAVFLVWVALTFPTANLSSSGPQSLSRRRGDFSPKLGRLV